ncbi:MAG: hypothetical protein JWO51_5359 [Rhodospirillales bacterium]|nr:hypothetical protein [Rhodospirillales bacterium]
MEMVGFYGGFLILEIGPVADMRLFFDCIRFGMKDLPKGTDGGLLTDRLYRRYLRLEELDPATALLGQVREILKNIKTKTIDWSGFKPDQSELDRSLPNLGALFAPYLDSALTVISDARRFHKEFDSYKPVITIITSAPRFYVEKQRPLAEYDALEGEPMWLR